MKSRTKSARMVSAGASLALRPVVLLGVFLVLVSSSPTGYGATSKKPAQTAPVISQVLGTKASILANGLQVVVIPNRKTSKIVHMVWYKVGAADDPPGKSGLAHFVEHLTFRGTKTLPEQQFFGKLKRVSVKQDGITTYDYTVYYEMGPPKQLATFMQLEADRMSNVVITERSVTSGRKGVLQERQHGNSGPHALLDERMHAALYRDHPYALPVLGWSREMDTIARDEAIAFYHQWYAPNNAIVLVYGGVTAEQVKSLAERYYGGISAREVPARQIQRDVMGKRAEPVMIKDNRVRAPIWRRDYLAPSYTAGANRHTYALQVLAEILGGTRYSRLHRSLVLNRALAKDVHVEYQPDSLGLTMFSIDVVLRPGTDPDELGRAVDFELKALIADGSSSRELVRAKRDTKIDTASFEDNLPVAAQLIGIASVNARTLEDLKAWPEQIAAVTAEQVREAARAIFLSDRSVTGVLLPQ